MSKIESQKSKKTTDKKLDLFSKKYWTSSLFYAQTLIYINEIKTSYFVKKSKSEKVPKPK